MTFFKNLNIKEKYVFINQQIIALILIFAGLYYAFTQTMIPYHQQFLATTVARMDPNYVLFYFQGIKLAGAFFLAFGIIISVLTFHQFSRESSSWIRWLLFVVLFIVFGSLIKITLTIGTHTPWWLAIIVFCLIVSNFFLSKRA